MHVSRAFYLVTGAFIGAGLIATNATLSGQFAFFAFIAMIVAIIFDYNEY